MSDADDKSWLLTYDTQLLPGLRVALTSELNKNMADMGGNCVAKEYENRVTSAVHRQIVGREAQLLSNCAKVGDDK